MQRTTALITFPTTTSRPPTPNLHSQAAGKPWFAFEYYPPRTEKGVENLCARFGKMKKQGESRICTVRQEQHPTLATSAPPRLPLPEPHALHTSAPIQPRSAVVLILLLFFCSYR